jgi:hypothetical protein
MSLKDLLSRLANQRNYPPTGHGSGTSEIESVPDFVEPLVGWRAWKVWAPAFDSDSCPGLTSIILNESWMPRRRIAAEHNFDLTARCRGLLDLECSCGIYAFKDPDEAFAYAARVRDRFLGIANDVALGEVSLWGRVVECERGFRAEFAYPRHIYLPSTFSRFISVVRCAFGVPTGIYASPCEEISISGFDRHHRIKSQVLLSKSLELARPDVFPHEVAFYDAGSF